jgi:hypothetical protein
MSVDESRPGACAELKHPMMRGSSHAWSEAPRDCAHGSGTQRAGALGAGAHHWAAAGAAGAHRALGGQGGGAPRRLRANSTWMPTPRASGGPAGVGTLAAHPPNGAWPNGWRTAQSPAGRRGSRPSRSARSSRWPARFRPPPTAPSASGAPGNWPMRSGAAALSTTSRHGTLGGYSKAADLKPHRIRYWLTPAAAEAEADREACIG